MPTYDELKTELQQIAKLLSEFPESLRPEVYELLVTQFLGTEATRERIQAKTEVHSGSRRSTAPASKPNREKAAARKMSGKESYSIDRNLDLRGDRNTPSFRDFHKDKQPRSAQEFNAVAVYYLKKILGLEKASLNHVYTCYREIDRRPPEAFKQSFIDAKNRGGWIEFDKDGHLEIPHRGAVFVESDLPHAPAK